MAAWWLRTNDINHRYVTMMILGLILINSLLIVQASAHSNPGSPIVQVNLKYITAGIEVINDDDLIINTTIVFTRQGNNIGGKLPSNKDSDSAKDGKLAYEAADFRKSDDVQIKARHLENLTLAITVDGVKYVLDLHLNKYLLPDGYKEHVINRDSKHTIDVDVALGNCYYTGVVRGYDRSVAAVSTCTGITGMFRIDNETFEINSEDDSSNSEPCLSCRHKVARSSDNVFNNGYKCGFKDQDRFKFKSRRKRAPIEVWPQDSDGLTRIVEVYGCNDYNQYLNFSSNSNDVFKRMKDLVNMASALYHNLNIYLVLVGAEVWTDNKIQANLANYEQFLTDFGMYGNANIKMARDVALLLTPLGAFSNGVIGLANTGTACQQAYAYCFVCDLSKEPGHVIDTVAHEIGHTLGLAHDLPPESTDPCRCDVPSGSCIMDATTNPILPTEWSTCSKNNLTSPEHFKEYFCLYNMPGTVFDPNSVCGNGLVESGEQCDCGKSPSSECNPSCCDSSTCQLINSAQCAFGRCCDVPTCKLKPRYTLCREASGDCDVSEYCSGSEYLCPTDVYKSQTTPCTVNSVKSYCYNGTCKTREDQCVKMLPTYQSGIAANECYTLVNTRGDHAGNCGPSDGIPALETWVPCADADVFCGLLQCSTTLTGVNTNPELVTFVDITGPSGQIRCVNSLERTLRRYSFVPDGATCGEGKVCQRQKCVDLTTLIGCTTNCSNHGVCNSLGECHCDVGYGGADCSQVGEGGSPHSNPISPSGPITSVVTFLPDTTTTTTVVLPDTTTTTTVATPTTAITVSVVSGASAATTAIATPVNENSISGLKSSTTNLLIVTIVPLLIIILGLLLCCLLYSCYVPLFGQPGQSNQQGSP